MTLKLYQVTLQPPRFDSLISCFNLFLQLSYGTEQQYTNCLVLRRRRGSAPFWQRSFNLFLEHNLFLWTRSVENVKKSLKRLRIYLLNLDILGKCGSLKKKNIWELDKILVMWCDLVEWLIQCPKRSPKCLKYNYKSFPIYPWYMYFEKTYNNDMIFSNGKKTYK